MLKRNNTPFAAIGFADRHRDGNMMAVIAVRGSFHISPDGSLSRAPNQSIVLSDEYAGEPHRSSLVKTTDLVPYKPRADITLVGTAYAPGGRAAMKWHVSIQVADQKASLNVYGPRNWEISLSALKPTWKLGQSTPATMVPVDYGLASGGWIIGDPDGRVDPSNPIGPGVLDENFTRRGRPFRAPQIDTDSALVCFPFTRVEPQGFGPIPPFWRLRQLHVGTIDDVWKRERAPRLPSDFNYSFYQCAPPPLVKDRLIGHEKILLSSLTRNQEKLNFDLPGIAPIAHHHWFDGRQITTSLKLDGLHLDLRKEPWCLDLTWRGWIETCPAYDSATIEVAAVADAQKYLTSAENGLTIER